MDSITTSRITEIIGVSIGFVDKIVWDWLKIENNYAVCRNDRSPCRSTP